MTIFTDMGRFTLRTLHLGFPQFIPLLCNAQICCLAGNIEDLAELGMLLVRSRPPLKKEDCQQVQTLMNSCGLYEASAQFAKEIGLPTKSGVSGVFLSIIPEQGAIAIYSPPLDPQGNSVAGLYLILKIAESLR
jgi:glutaminase